MKRVLSQASSLYKRHIRLVSNSGIYLPSDYLKTKIGAFS
jgi:hypothetical protein